MLRTVIKKHPLIPRFSEPLRFVAIRRCALLWLSLLAFSLVRPAETKAEESSTRVRGPAATGTLLQVQRDPDPVLQPPLRPIETLILKNGDRMTGHSHDVYLGGLLFENLYGSRTVVPIDEIDRLEWEGPENASPDPSAADAPPPVVTPPPKPLTAAELLEHELELFRIESRMWLRGQGLHPYRIVRRISALEYATMRVWTRRFSLGGAYLTGNSRQESVDIAVDLERTIPGWSTQINIAGRYGAMDGIRTANRWTANGTHDWKPVQSKWMAYGKVMDEFDEFQNLDYRGVYSLGVGYRFFDDARRRLIARVGPAATVEIFHRPSRQRFTGDIFNELEIRWPLAERLDLEQRTTFHPSVTDYRVFRVVNNTAVMYALDAKRTWNLRLGFHFLHVSVPNPGRLQSDYTTNLSIVYQRQ
jgi:putative salt-induced outer membrane protein YdiY